jgi:hypothetical protein
MTVEPFTHLRPVAGNHANLHNLNAVPVSWLQACVPAPAAGLQLLRRGRAGPGIPVLLPRGAGAVPASWPACCRWPARPGSAAARRWRSCRPWDRLVRSGKCRLVLDFKHTFPCGVPVAFWRRAVRADSGRMRAGEPRAFECLATPASLRTGLCRRFRVRDDGPGFAAVPVRCAAGRGRRRGSGSGKIRVDPRFSAAAGAVPGGGFAVVREGV